MARTLRTKPALAQVEYARDADNGSGRSPAAVRAATAVAPDTAPEGEPAPGAFDGISKPQPKSPAQRVLKGHIDVVEWPRIEGWVFAPEMPNERIRLELAEGGDRLQTVVASAGRPDIVTAGVGDGLHGFEIDLHDSELAAGRHLLNLRCADTGTEIPGSPIILEVPAKPRATNGAAAPARAEGEPVGAAPVRAAAPVLASAIPAGIAAAAGPAHQTEVPAMPDRATERPKLFRSFIDEVSDEGITGWIMVREQPSRRCVVTLKEGGRVLARTVASRFRDDLVSVGIGDGCYAFVLPIPRWLFDGAEHLLEIVEEDTGFALTAEPVRWRSAAAPAALSGASDRADAGGLLDFGRPPLGEAQRPPMGARADYQIPIASALAARQLKPSRGHPRAAAFIGPRILFDISDLVYYIGEHANLTGIQRVQSSIVLAILSNAILPQSQLVFLSFNAKARNWVVIPTGFLASLLEDLFLPETERLVSFPAEEARYGMLPGAREFDGSGILGDAHPSVLCLLGAAWVHQDYIHRVLALKRRFGTRFVMTVHDLIPIYARETCDQDTARVFEEFMRRALRHADHILSVSENTARDVRRYTRALAIPEPPITVTRNGSSFAEFLSKGAPAGETSLTALPERFVLFVATIEGRKNHQLMLDIWRRMIADGDDPPHLVCVGRLGWKSGAFISALVETDYLGGRVHLLRDICDADLRLLYSRCLFTVCPTFYEGWGLPIGESLAMGKICVSSDRASVPEVAGEFGVYIDIGNFEQSLETVRGLIADPAARRKLEHKIRRGYAPITWQSVAEKVVTACLAAPKTEWQQPYPYTAIPYSTEISFGRLDRDADGTGEALLARIAGMRRGCFLREPLAEQNFLWGEEIRAAGSWAYPEDWGTWACYGGGELDLALTPTGSQTYFVFLRLRASGLLTEHPIQLSANNETVWHNSLGPRPRNIVVPVRRAAAGSGNWRLRLRAEIDLSPELQEKIAAEDSRIPTIGFERLVVVPEDDLKSRLDILSTLLL